MKKIYILWSSIIILIIGIMLFIGYNMFIKNKEYKELENNMERVVSKYLGQYIEDYPKSGEKKVNITDVINKGYQINMNVNSDVCDGYVVIKKVSFAYEYDGYIKCEDYITKGYNIK